MREKSLKSSTIDVGSIDAWIFDLDGVITDTASLHMRSWTELFTNFFNVLGADGITHPIKPFEESDYFSLVDGESRMNGIYNVLHDRGIVLPDGAPGDPPGVLSVWGLANEKEQRFLKLLAETGPNPFPASIALLRKLKAAEVPIGVVSSSRNCAKVLSAAGVADLVDVRVDGETAKLVGLASKPDPAMFLEASRRLKVDPSRAAVVEDALSGVEAGRAGKFGLVIGVDRQSHEEGLYSKGADIVVKDLGELRFKGKYEASTRAHLGSGSNGRLAVGSAPPKLKS